MTDTAAREEAERRYPQRHDTVDSAVYIEHEAAFHAFIAGTEWRDAQVAELVKAARMCRDVTNEDEDIEAWTALVAALEAFERALSDPGEGAPEK